MLALSLFALGCAYMALVYTGSKLVNPGEQPAWMLSSGGQILLALFALVAPFLPIGFAPLAGVRWWLGLPVFVGAFLLAVVVRVFLPSMLRLRNQFLAGLFLIIAAIGIVRANTWAFNSLTDAAARGSVSAQYRLGVLYANGDGVEKDTTKALEWYRKAAAQGHAHAQTALGGALLAGVGIPKDERAGLDWLGKAARQRNPEAMELLAMVYQLGQSVPKDGVLACAWANLLIDAAPGDTGAVRLRDSIARHLSPGELAEAQRLAASWKPGSNLVREQ